MGDYILEKMEQEKIIWHAFNKENNNKAHIEKKEEEVTNMIAAMGLILNNYKYNFLSNRFTGKKKEKKGRKKKKVLNLYKYTNYRSICRNFHKMLQLGCCPIL